MRNLKLSFQPYACNAHATQGFMQGMQHMQDVSNDVAGICHMIWLASNKNVLFLLQVVFSTLCCLHKPSVQPCIACIACVRLETSLYAV